MANVDWNTEEYQQGRSFDVMPKGRYLTRIDKIEKKDTKSKDGYYFEVELSVEKGDQKGRKAWARLNVSNKSEVAQRIGREQFNSLCVAAGFKVGEVRDTKSLHAKRVVALIDVEKDNRGETRNAVTGFIAPSAEEAATKSERGSGSAPAKPNPKTEIEDDDIPF